jgi:hypothetical protein
MDFPWITLVLIWIAKTLTRQTLLKQLGAHLNSLDKLLLLDLTGHTWTCLLSTAWRLLPLTKEWTYPIRIYASVWILTLSKNMLWTLCFGQLTSTEVLLMFVTDDNSTHASAMSCFGQTKQVWRTYPCKRVKVTCKQGDSMTTNLDSFLLDVTGSQLATLLSAA